MTRLPGDDPDPQLSTLRHSRRRVATAQERIERLGRSDEPNCEPDVDTDWKAVFVRYRHTRDEAILTYLGRHACIAVSWLLVDLSFDQRLRRALDPYVPVIDVTPSLLATMTAATAREILAERSVLRRRDRLLPGGGSNRLARATVSLVTDQWPRVARAVLGALTDFSTLLETSCGHCLRRELESRPTATETALVDCPRCGLTIPQPRGYCDSCGLTIIR
ncbi:hypothetical protein [Haloarcula amylolytica]|uniref:hypothetical protein n=1 Tax=Haloarcula amylolytica TaxID=396317 RepID=UPI003C710A57